jgi:hypothetical protein
MKVVLIGDFNADPVSRHGQLFDHLISVQSLTPLIKEPTRITSTSQTLLDQCVTNCPNLIVKAEVTTPIAGSDHCTIAVYCSSKPAQEKPYKRTMWKFSDENLLGYKNAVTNYDWETQLAAAGNDVNKACEDWTNVILEIAKSTVTNQNVTIRPSDKPWYSHELRKLKHNLDKAFKTFKTTKQGEHLQVFRRLRSEYQSKIRDQKRRFEEEKYSNLTNRANEDPKRWWSLLKTVYKNADIHDPLPPLKDNDAIITDNREKSSLFNNFFLSASTLDTSEARLPDRTNIVPDVNTLNDIVVSEEEVGDQISCLNCSKSYGPDSISPRFLKNGGDKIVTTLTYIFNLSLATKTFPESWKLANVIPVHKKDDKSEVNNYRPISLLSVVGKIFERIVFKHVYNFLRDNYVISSAQSGFRPGMSTVTQLLEVYDSFCQALDNSQEVRAVFLDISKAFDKIWHEGLLYKLKCCGINGSLHDWFVDYLSRRKQRVVICGQNSEWGDLSSGVPQGSVLGPLLFLVYINDLTSVVSHSNIRLFADDTCLFVKVNDRIEAAGHINADLQMVEKWAKQWVVEFSAKKTKSLIISNKADSHLNPPVLLNNVPIEEVKFYKYLGLHFTSNLRWNLHIDKVAKLAEMKLNMLLPLKWKIDRDSLETMYNTYVLSSMTYANVVWGGTYASDLLKLERIHIDGMRLITGATARSNIAKLYADTGFCDFTTICNNAMLIMMHRMVNGNCPNYLQALVPPQVESKTTYNLRNRQDLAYDTPRLDSVARSFVHKAAMLWNKLSTESRNNPSLSSFKKSLKKKEDRSIYKHGKRWPSIHHAQLRIGCSKLSSDLCNNLHVTNNASCVCGEQFENATHYFLHCPLFTHERQELVNVISQHSNVDINVLLHGNQSLSIEQNKVIFDAVHKYILDSNRFA